MRQHKFTLTISDTAPLIEFPAQPWNGFYDKRDSGGATIVNLRRFVVVVEEVVSRIEQQAKKDTLALATKVTPAELGTRFGFTIIDPRAG